MGPDERRAFGRKDGERVDFTIVLAMFAVGVLLGFVGAGGSGFIISILTTAFGYPIHTALGTALLAMLFSSLSGTVSHYRDGNVALRTGVIAGLAGALGAWAGSLATAGIPEHNLVRLTAAMLTLSGLALWLRMAMVARQRQKTGEEPVSAGTQGPRSWFAAGGVGAVTGVLSGLFGIGSTPFIQLGLMTALGLTPRLAAGTTMLVIVPIAFGGGLGFYQLGYVDAGLLTQVAVGIIAGSYAGAKLTKRAPVRLLQAAMVLFPMIGAAILLL